MTKLNASTIVISINLDVTYHCDKEQREYEELMLKRKDMNDDGKNYHIKFRVVNLFSHLLFSFETRAPFELNYQYYRESPIIYAQVTLKNSTKRAAFIKNVTLKPEKQFELVQLGIDKDQYFINGQLILPDQKRRYVFAIKTLMPLTDEVLKEKQSKEGAIEFARINIEWRTDQDLNYMVFNTVQLTYKRDDAIPITLILQPLTEKLSTDKIAEIKLRITNLYEKQAMIKLELYEDTMESIKITSLSKYEFINVGMGESVIVDAHIYPENIGLFELKGIKIVTQQKSWFAENIGFLLIEPETNYINETRNSLS